MPLRKNDLEAYNVNIHQSLARTIGQCMTNLVVYTNFCKFPLS